MSITAAVPMIEWLELHVIEISVRKMHASSGDPIFAFDIASTPARITSDSNPYKAAATGDRRLPKNLSDKNPAPNDPATAAAGSRKPSHANSADSFVICHALSRYFAHQ